MLRAAGRQPPVCGWTKPNPRQYFAPIPTLPSLTVMFERPDDGGPWQAVAGIPAEVRARGAAARRDHTARFDQVTVDELRATDFKAAHA